MPLISIHHEQWKNARNVSYKSNICHRLQTLLNIQDTHCLELLVPNKHKKNQVLLASEFCLV